MSTEYGWLIEVDIDGPKWWGGGGLFNTDANYAIRFARKVDAEEMIKYVPKFFGADSRPIKPIATEHAFG